VSQQTARRSSYDVHDLDARRFCGHPAVITWLTSHGADPNNTVAFEIDGDQLHIVEYARTADGKIKLDRHGLPVRAKPYSVPLLSPLPLPEL
jgi:hypothetical protein